MHMLRKLFVLILSIFLSVYVVTYAGEKSDGLKPRWMTSALPTPKSDGYIFVMAQGSGSSLDEARQRALVNLTTKLEHERGLTINSRISVDSKSSRHGSVRENTSLQTYSMECQENDKKITLITRVVDEYWERSGGEYTVTELFTVNDANALPNTGSYSDEIYTTTHYGAAPVFMSLIPGIGQIYKGSTLKGSLILGGSVVCVGGIVTGQTMHDSYVNKRKEYPQHFDFYNKRAADWNNIRNVFIGVGVACYVYNLIDAAVAPGRRQVKVKRGHVRPSFSAVPTVIPDFSGNVSPAIALNINF